MDQGPQRYGRTFLATTDVRPATTGLTGFAALRFAWDGVADLTSDASRDRGSAASRVRLPSSREPDAPARRPLRQRLRIRGWPVLAIDPRPPGAGRALHGDSHLDWPMVQPLRRPLVASVGVSRPH